jgi:hypothetical protein
MAIFWDIAPCSLVEVHDVSEMLTASIIKVMNNEPLNFSRIALKHLDQILRIQADKGILTLHTSRQGKDNEIRASCQSHKS